MISQDWYHMLASIYLFWCLAHTMGEETAGEKSKRMQNKCIAERGIHPRTCRLWAQHANYCATSLMNLRGLQVQVPSPSLYCVRWYIVGRSDTPNYALRKGWRKKYDLDALFRNQRSLHSGRLYQGSRKKSQACEKICCRDRKRDDERKSQVVRQLASSDKAKVFVLTTWSGRLCIVVVAGRSTPQRSIDMQAQRIQRIRVIR